jgi:hypothetical protein
VVQPVSGRYPEVVRRPRFTPALAAIAAAALVGAAPADASTAAASQTASAAAAQTKKKRSTSARVTALSKSLNRAKSQQRAAQKQIDALVKQQAAIGGTINDAVAKINGAAALTGPAGLLAALQDPTTGIPQYFQKIQDEAIGAIKALLASQEYAVIVVTVGDEGLWVSPTPLISPDIPDIGAPVTVSGTMPIAIPPGLAGQRVDVRVGAVSLESEKGAVADPPFVANLNYMSVSAGGFTGDGADATISGGNAGVNFTHDPDNPAANCFAGSGGCGAGVWSAGNPDLGGLPYWPVTEKLVSFDGTSLGSRFDVTRMTPLTSGGKLAAITTGSTGPIRVGTTAATSGASILRVDVSVTLTDLSVNPADPFA